MNQLKIMTVVYVDDYRLNIYFNDKTFNQFDYKSMVTSEHEEFKRYLDVTKFKKFRIAKNRTTVVWGKSWDMILPLETLYSKKYIRVKDARKSKKAKK